MVGDLLHDVRDWRLRVVANFDLRSKVEIHCFSPSLVAAIEAAGLVRRNELALSRRLDDGESNWRANRKTQEFEAKRSNSVSRCRHSRSERLPKATRCRLHDSAGRDKAAGIAE
jgi:hypothetical protein